LLATKELRRHLDDHGGLTIDPATGQRVSGGLAVCPDRRWSRALPWPLQDDGALRAWLAHLHAHLEPGRFIGAWLDRPRRVAWVEAVVVVPSHDRRSALALAARAEQHAIYDLDRCRTVHLASRGRP